MPGCQAHEQEYKRLRRVTGSTGEARPVREDERAIKTVPNEPIPYETMNRLLNIFIQLLLISGIFGFLFWSAFTPIDSDGKNIFTLLLEQSIRWEFLFAALLSQILTQIMIAMRFYWLLRSLGLKCSYHNALRVNMYSLIFSLAPLGGAVADIARAVMIAQKNPEYEPQAAASTLIDRLLGLVILSVIGAVLICWTGMYARTEVTAQAFTLLTFIFAAAGLFGAGIAFLPFFAKGHLERVVEKVPLCGKFAGQFIQALFLYQNHKRCLAACTLITIPAQIIYGMSLFFIAMALFPTALDSIYHVTFHPCANLTTLIPLAAGPYEFAMEQLYVLYGMPAGTGLIISLSARLLLTSIAIAGIICYWIIQRQSR